MACIIHTNLYDDKVLMKMQKDLTKKIESGNKQYGTSQSKTIYVYSVDEEVESRPCCIPFSYGLKLALKKNLEIQRPNRKSLGGMQHEFTGSLRDEQKNCRDQALTLLQKSKSVMLSCYTGFGKTVTAINMASKIKLKTLIVVPKNHC
jgi:superfamily II DNA or RNA helicase